MERAAGDFGQQWVSRSADLLSALEQWRAQHPQATLQEIEAELDQRVNQMRAHLLEHVAQQSATTTWSLTDDEHTTAPADPPRCPHCDVPLRPRGRKTRRLKTQGGQELTLQREYGVCPQCGQGLFPPR